MQNKVYSSMLTKTLLWTARAVAIIYTMLLLVFFIGEGINDVINYPRVLLSQWPTILAIILATIANYKMFKYPIIATKFFAVAAALILINFIFIGKTKDYMNVFVFVVPYVYIALTIYIFRDKQN